MDISYLEETADEPAPCGRRFAHVMAVGRTLCRLFRLAGRMLMYDPLAKLRRQRFRNDDGSRTARFIRGTIYRLGFVPIAAALFACALVYSGTHPLNVVDDQDPGTLGVYYDPISFRSADGKRVDAWIFPAIDARTVLQEKDKVLRDKRAAVVLLHDYANPRQQLLPLIAPLHEAGFVVLVPALRGSGTSERAGQTFGLRESLDVKAAVELLRKKQGVDPDRIALVGIGTGASAAVLASASDARLRTLVLQDPPQGIDESISRHIVPAGRWLRWVQPLCKWAFEIAYEVDAEELNVTRYAPMLRTRQVLKLDGQAGGNSLSQRRIEQIREFLSKRLVP